MSLHVYYQFCSANKKRQLKNSRYGHGGQKKRSKFNTAESTADMSDFKRNVNQKKPSFNKNKVKLLFSSHICSNGHLFIHAPQAFRFMVGPGHCPMISKYGPSLSKAVDLSFLVVKKSHFNKKKKKYRESRNSTKQKVHVGSQYSKTCLKQPLKKDKTKILITNGSLMKVESIAECSPWTTLH